jgi:hypothetical protein
MNLLYHYTFMFLFALLACLASYRLGRRPGSESATWAWVALLAFCLFFLGTFSLGAILIAFGYSPLPWPLDDFAKVVGAFYRWLPTPGR